VRPCDECGRSTANLDGTCSTCRERDVVHQAEAVVEDEMLRLFGPGPTVDGPLA
jgi:hypothetical protein